MLSSGAEIHEQTDVFALIDDTRKDINPKMVMFKRYVKCRSCRNITPDNATAVQDGVV